MLLFLFIHFYFYHSAAQQTKGLTTMKKVILISALGALVVIGAVLGVVFGLHLGSCEYIYQ
jgi:hypothetical protein